MEDDTLEDIVEVCFEDPCFHEKISTEEFKDIMPKLLFYYGRLVDYSPPRPVKVINFYDSSGEEHDGIALPFGCVRYIRKLDTDYMMYTREDVADNDCAE